MIDIRLILKLVTFNQLQQCFITISYCRLCKQTCDSMLQNIYPVTAVVVFLSTVQYSW